MDEAITASSLLARPLETQYMSGDRNHPCLNRRRFLSLVGAGSALVVVGGAAGCSTGFTMSVDPFAIGAVTDHPVGVFKLYSSQGVIVGRDAGGFYAFSAVCTHEGTEIGFAATNPACAPAASGCTQGTTAVFVCPNHGARFDGNGVVTRGPASTNLPHYQVTLAAGQLTVNPSAPIGAAVRTAV
jgi:nitrite reductase/ring-hydroxylating ferredoxin subunit